MLCKTPQDSCACWKFPYGFFWTYPKSLARPIKNLQNVFEMLVRVLLQLPQCFARSIRIDPYGFEIPVRVLLELPQGFARPINDSRTGLKFPYGFC